MLRATIVRVYTLASQPLRRAVGTRCVHSWCAASTAGMRASAPAPVSADRPMTGRPATSGTCRLKPASTKLITCCNHKVVIDLHPL